MAESDEYQRARVRAMTSDAWDLGEADRSALKYVLAELDRLRASAPTLLRQRDELLGMLKIFHSPIGCASRCDACAIVARIEAEIALERAK